MPEGEHNKQVQVGSPPIIATNEGGFPMITTVGGYELWTVPAPKSIKELAILLGMGSRVIVDKQGAISLNYQPSTRENGDVYYVVIFDYLLEPPPANICVEISPGNTQCDFNNAPIEQQPGLHFLGNVRSARAVSEQARMVFGDGSSQLVRPTLLEPDLFIAEAMKFEGMKRVVFNVDGTFTVFYNNESYIVVPTFDVSIQDAVEGSRLEPNIVYHGQGRLTYSVPAIFEENGQPVHKIVVFNPILEPAPGNLCVETADGKVLCEFSS
jgi:hypothetical protein